MGDNLCTEAHMEFDLMYVHFPHMTLNWIISNVKFNSESIGGVVFPHTCTQLILNEQFLTSTSKDVHLYLNEYLFKILVGAEAVRLRRSGLM